MVTSSEYLAELIAKAEALRPRFQRDVVQALEAAGLTGVVEVRVGPLKRPGRITQKAAEKYRGDFSRVLDIVRLTVVCQDVATLTQTFVAMANTPVFELCRTKNRLHPAFDPTASAGYR